jgi:hypothetical protein
MLSNKKGEGLHIGFMILYIIMFGIILIVMGFVLLIITNRYINGFLAYDPDLPTNIYAYRAINTCLAYQDSSTERYYPGIIDFAKYNQQTLDNCYTNTDVRSFNIQLKDLQKPEDYPAILVGFGASLRINSYSILIKYDDGAMNQGELLFGVS